MSVTRYFYKKLEDGSMSETPTHLGAKAEYVTIKPAEGEELLNAQSEFERMWQMDTHLENKIDTEITDRKNAITEEATARQNADNTLQTNINTEAEARAAAVKAEQEAREAAISAEQKARDEEDDKILEALATEVTDRQTAIDTAIATEVTNRNNAISDAIGDLADDLAQIETNTTDIYNLQKRVLLDTEQVITSEGAITLKEDVTNLHSMEIEISYNGNNVGYYSIKPGTTSLTFTSLSSTGFKNSSVTFTTSESTLTVIPNASMSIDAEGTIVMQEGLLEDTEFKILNIYGYK